MNEPIYDSRRSEVTNRTLSSTLTSAPASTAVPRHDVSSSAAPRATTTRRNTHHSPRSSWTESLVFDNLLPHTDEAEQETVESVKRAFQQKQTPPPAPPQTATTATRKKAVTSPATWSLTSVNRNIVISSPIAFSQRSNSPKARRDNNYNNNISHHNGRREHGQQQQQQRRLGGGEGGGCGSGNGRPPQPLPPPVFVCRMGSVARGPLTSIPSSGSSTPPRTTNDRSKGRSRRTLSMDSSEMTGYGGNNSRLSTSTSNFDDDVSSMISSSQYSEDDGHHHHHHRTKGDGRVNNDGDDGGRGGGYMRPSMEAEMMDRLLQLVYEEDHRKDSNANMDSHNMCPKSHTNKNDHDNHLTNSKGPSNKDTCKKYHEQQQQQPRMMLSGKGGATVISDASYWKEKKYIQRYINELKDERETMKEVWMAEFQKELADEEEEEQKRRRFRRTSSSILSSINECVRRTTSNCFDSIMKVLWTIEAFVANIPLTIGAIGLSAVTNGTVWFKFMEEYLDSCIPTHYFGPECVYYEFPSCFACDTSNSIYKAALGFHLICHAVAALCCILFLGKCMVAWRVVADELSNPTTATPMGVVCITVICVLAGRFGIVGEIGVVGVSIFHVMLSFWFLYIAVFRFRLWPDPSWFPNTVGIAYAAVKSFLYFPTFGWALMILCVTYLLGTFFLAIYRAYTNLKISAPVCFISLSAPSITMYAMTIVAQPTPEREALLEESPELITQFDQIRRMAYIPSMHVMMFLSILGFASALHCLFVRWDEFKLKPFSPAHAAFVFPVLSHTNAIQAYRRVIISFSIETSPYHKIVTIYWIICLVGGTILNFVFTSKYIARLPKWTNFDKVAEETSEDETPLPPPPEPNNTIVHELWTETNAHEALREHFSNPAVLQANEAGILVRRRRGTQDYNTKGPYARSRRTPSIGFDPIMTQEELRKERAELLDWVVKNNPRTRNKTMSIPIGGYGTFGLQIGSEGGPESQIDPSLVSSHRRTLTDTYV